MDTLDNIELRASMAHYEIRARVRYAKANIAARFERLEREFELRRVARGSGWDALAAALILRGCSGKLFGKPFRRDHKFGPTP